MPVNRRIAALIALLLLALAGTTAAVQAGDARPPSASAQAFARQTGSGGATDYVSVTGDGERAGSETRAQASTNGTRASATAAAAVEGVNVFDGLVTAGEVRVRAQSAGEGTSTSGAVLGLAIEGRTVDAPAGRTSYDLNGYGTLVALESGATGILGLRVTLTKDYKGHAAGSVVRVGYASAKARDGVRATPAPAAAPSPAKPAEKRSARVKKARRKKRELSGRERLERAVTEYQRQQTAALLATPGYAFPVAGDSSFSDDWGAPRATTGTHIGNDIFAPFGTPVVAVADGRLYRVGTRKISGNRLWLRDKRGHRFFYAHLADFSAAAFNGADVHAGEVIGFVGSTGDAEQTPPHVHFEIHLRDRSPINPFPLLQKWEGSGVGTARWVKRYGKDPGVRPGALVVVKDFLAE